MFNRRIFEGNKNHTIYALIENRVMAHGTTVGPQTERRALLVTLQKKIEMQNSNAFMYHLENNTQTHLIMSEISEIIGSIKNEFNKMEDAAFKEHWYLNGPGVPEEVGDPEDYEYDFSFDVDEHTEKCIKKINKMTKQFITKIKNHQFDHQKYHDDVTKFYEDIGHYIDSIELSPELGIDYPIEFLKFKRMYKNYYLEKVIKPYQMTLINESISIIKHKTPIADDNICDIMSYLNDKKIITKHEVDTIIYA
jgi:hypothetical protein